MGPKKQQKMSLGDFMADQSLGSWADEMEDMPLPSDSRTGYGSDRRTFSSGGSFGGGSSFDRPGYQRESLPLPTKPPFTAHLGNLSFDATEGDVHDFFADCAVTNVRIVEDKMERKPKGFGYVEFGTLDGLKKALQLNGLQFQGRNIRISVAEPPKDRAEGRELNDWTRKGPLPDLPSNRRVSDRPSGFHRNMDNMSDAGSERSERRRPAFETDGRTRDFGNWERKGPLSPNPATQPGREGPRGHDGPRERKVSPNWAEARSQEPPHPPRRDSERPPPAERAPTASELDNQWRARMRPDAPAKAPAKSPATTPDTSMPSSPAPAVRPKLNLAKRTVSEAEPAPSSAASASSDTKASPFGAARPIDTASREKEVEEKLRKLQIEKKEQEEKAKEEKKAREAAAKAEKAALAAQEANKSDSKNGDADTNAADGKQEDGAGKGGDGIVKLDPVDEPANGAIAEDKAVKPKETVVRPNKPSEASGSWRRGSSKPKPESHSTTENMEADGWSTVTKAKNNRRGGNAGARPIAS
jgi:translation initiation factor 4B